MSTCRNLKPCLTRHASTVLNADSLTVGEYVSWYSKPGVCVKPRATKRALYFVTLPSSLTFTAKCHFPVIGCRSVGRETRDHTSFVIKELYSRCIAAFQLGSARASGADPGTVDATNASLCVLELVPHHEVIE